MADWRFDDGPVAVGIDVGWSETRKSCALAVHGLTVPSGARDWTTYRGARRPLAVGLFRFTDLLPAVRELFAALGDRRSRATVVVDGPIGPAGPPATNRHVDAAFTRGEFNARMQPSPVATGDGPKYAAVTDRLVRAVHEAAGVEYRPGVWDGQPATGLTVCETHPTVGLALLLPKQDRRTLPSRNAARRLPVDTPAYRAEDSPFVRAKSDWYWQLGAGRWVAEEALGCPAVARELNHERVAGLYCLAVATLLATDARRVVAVGGSDGVYVIPAAVDRGWAADLEGLVWRGSLMPADHTRHTAAVSAPPVTVASAPAEPVGCGPDDADEAEKGDATYLILNDPVGVWVKHNDWLEGLDPLVAVRIGGEGGEVICLRAGNRPDRALWVAVDEEQRPLRLARRHGFTGDHLSRACAWQIPISVLGSGLAECPG